MIVKYIKHTHNKCQMCLSKDYVLLDRRNLGFIAEGWQSETIKQILLHFHIMRNCMSYWFSIRSLTIIITLWISLSMSKFAFSPAINSDSRYLYLSWYFQHSVNVSCRAIRCSHYVWQTEENMLFWSYPSNKLVRFFAK